MPSQHDRGSGPSQESVKIAILTVPDSGQVVVRFCGPVIGIWTHWRQGRSVACVGPGECPPVIHRERTLWKGYAAVEELLMARPRKWRPAVLEVTEGLNEYLTSENPRGEVWQLQRAAVREKRAECRGVLIRNDDPRELRVDIDVETAVKRLYRCLFIAFGMDPPFGQRQVLEISQARNQGHDSTSARQAADEAKKLEEARALLKQAGGSVTKAGSLQSRKNDA